MKNIHILPTDQPSKLGYISESKTYHLYNNDVFLDELANAISIYITSDEQGIKGDYVIHTPTHKLIKVMERVRTADFKKIILTTDPTLIADGVQAIDDEFLEWFVKNPSCDFVGVDKIPDLQSYNEKTYKCELVYTITIPQEESKQEKKPHLFCETPEAKCTMNYCDDNGCQNRKRHLVEQHEQEPLEEVVSKKNNIIDSWLEEHGDPEICKTVGCRLEEITLEKAAEQHYIHKTNRIPVPTSNWVNSKELQIQTFIEGAKWQAQRMYSEEEVLDLLYKRDLYLLNRDETKELELPNDWFEQNKKK